MRRLNDLPLRIYPEDEQTPKIVAVVVDHRYDIIVAVLASVICVDIEASLANRHAILLLKHTN